MKTTTVLAEFLVVGLQCALLAGWAGYVFLGWNMTTLASWDAIGDWVAFLLLLYAFGILWGRLADVLVWPLDRWLKDKVFRAQPVKCFDRKQYHAALLDIHIRHSALAESMAQVRSQYRIARATALTGLAALVVTGFQPFLRPVALDQTRFIGIMAFAAIFLLLGLETYRHLRGHYLGWTADYISRFADASTSVELIPKVPDGTKA